MSEAAQPSSKVLSINDADLDDLSLFAGVQKEAEENRDRNSDDNRAPLTYMEEGSYWIRMYPELILDEAGNRKLVPMRRLWSYGRNFGVRRLPAPKDENCPIRKEVQRLRDADYKEAFKYTASEEGVIKAVIFKASGAAEKSKYTKLNEPVFIVMRRKQMLALDQFLADMSPEDLRQVLDFRKKANVLKISFTKGSGGSASFGFDLMQKELPPLPDDFPSMYDVLVTDETPPPTDEEIIKYRKGVTALLAASNNVMDPTEDGGGNGAPEGDRGDAARAAVAEAKRQAAEEEAKRQAAAEAASKATEGASDSAGTEAPAPASEVKESTSEGAKTDAGSAARAAVMAALDGND